MYHDGSNSHIHTSTSSTGDLYINAQGTNHDLYLQAVDDILIRPQGGENGIKVHGNDNVELYYNNVRKLRTTSTGVNVEGDVVISDSLILTIPASTNDSSGIVFGVANSSVTFGQVYFLNTAGNSWGVALSSSSNCTRLIALGAGTSSSKMLFNGMFKAASHGFTIGSPLYIANSNGTLTETAPTTAGHFVRVVAYAISANEIYFNPDNTWIELT